MYKVSTKRQITLPKELCDKIEIYPGDYVEIFEYNGQVTLIKKTSGASLGSLKHLKTKKSVSDHQSMLDALHDRH